MRMKSSVYQESLTVLQLVFAYNREAYLLISLHAGIKHFMFMVWRVAAHSFYFHHILLDSHTVTLHGVFVKEHGHYDSKCTLKVVDISIVPEGSNVHSLIALLTRGFVMVCLTAEMDPMRHLVHAILVMACSNAGDRAFAFRFMRFVMIFMPA